MRSCDSAASGHPRVKWPWVCDLFVESELVDAPDGLYAICSGRSAVFKATWVDRPALLL